MDIVRIGCGMVAFVRDGRWCGPVPVRAARFPDLVGAAESGVNFADQRWSGGVRFLMRVLFYFDRYLCLSSFRAIQIFRLQKGFTLAHSNHIEVQTRY